MKNHHSKIKWFPHRIRLVVMLSFGFLTAAAQWSTSSKITVDLSRPGHAISPWLYNGMLFEEIGHGVDGGFYAQLVSNNSFEDNIPESGWTSVYHGSSYDTSYSLMTSETEQLNKFQNHCLRLDIKSVTSGSPGIANGGFWGMRLDNNTKYKVFFFARKDPNFTGALTIKLESNSGEVYASSDSIVPTTEWKKYSFDLTTNGISKPSKNNRVTIYASSKGSVYLDVVSVMPPTYKNRPNGMRIDMADMQAALVPKLIRFPGGCDVEHTTVDSGWNWKHTIGPIEERPGEVVQHWHYRNSEQFGLDEMLQMCEDWGAEPIYCTSMSIDDYYVGVPIEKIQPFVQDCLDLIEYANGDASTTYWGKKRAANGHPASYHLKYIEVGNENGTTKGYPERYAIFYNAIKKAYPSMNVIINDKLSGQQTDIIDEHFYGSYDMFLNLAGHYDNYDRKGPKIVAGEYSTKDNEIEPGNLRYAIGEAAFLTGCERNSDIVISTTYGTLSENTSTNTWYPNLYYNDAYSVFGIPSYYVEKMFVENTGDVVLPYTVNGKLYVAPSLVSSNGDLVIKVVNASDSISSSEIVLDGGKGRVQPAGLAITLTSGNLSDENSIEEPTKVSSTSASFPASRRFKYSFPAHSVTVLRIRFAGKK
jgi:alpha-L-arabinofuranosidase